MALTINTNVASLTAQRNLNTSQAAMQVSLQRLSSGLRINSAKDDAAGLAIVERFTSQVRGLNQAVRNANDGVSLAQTAEGALSQSSSLLQRMRELSIQSANATNSATDRAALQAEVNQLKDELTRVAKLTTFNGISVLDGTYSNKNFQIGANANQTINVSIAGVAATDLANYGVTAANTTANQGTGQAAAAAASLPAANVIAAQTLTVSGSSGTTTVAVAAGDSAYTVATNINSKTGTTGVTAKGYNEATLSGLSAAGTVTLTLGSGSTTATVSAAVSTTDLTALGKAINDVTGTTGITAEVTGGSLKLIQADGKDIQLADFALSTNGTISVTGLGGDAVTLTEAGGADTDSTVIGGSVTLASSAAYSLSSSVANTAGSILDVGANTAVSSTAARVSAVDIGTVAGAQSAIDVIDSALAKVSTIRADLGAVQTRFELAINNLQTTAENLSAARSRVQDADFAAETANMTRSQILQQAGVAMLAQANAQPNSVLALLRG